MPNKESERPVFSSQDMLMSLLMGSSITRFIGIAVNLGIADLLKDETVAANVIAEKCGTRQEETYRFLRGLSCVGVVEEHAEQHFALTPVGRWLRTDIPGSFAALAILHHTLWSGPVYGNLEHTLKTGENAFKKTYGCNLFEWLESHPEQEALFGAAMSTYSAMEVDLVLDTYDFSGFKDIVDVGGGHGMLLTAILRKVSKAKGILFDCAAVVEQAQGGLREFGERIQVCSGDFFEAVPEGGELYILKHVLHDWDDNQASRILQNVVAAMPPAATLLVIEQGITPPGVPGPGKLMDLSMMALTDGGKERTPEQLQGLLERAGLRYLRAIHTTGPISIFEGQLA